MHRRRRSNDLPKDPFAYIAFWQLLTFIFLILLVWVNELRAGAMFFYNDSLEDINVYRGFILTAAVLVTAIIAVGNTYLQQRRVLRTLVSVCSICRRVRLNNEVWQKLEDYIGERSLLTFTTGICPDCSKDLATKIGNN